jgi:hypothetical protein
MLDSSFLDWPFFDARHRALAGKLEPWAAANLAGIDHHDTDAACRRLVTQLGEDGWLKLTAPGDGVDKLDVRSLALCRETLARHDGLADFSFAMQGLAVRQRLATRSLAAADSRGKSDRRVRADRGRLRVGRGQYRHHCAA